MLAQGFSAGRSFAAVGQQPVLRNVGSCVLKRCNSTMAATQARPEEWDYAKPFEDMPGPKPLPVIGNSWRFIPFLGKLFFHYVTKILKEHRPFVHAVHQWSCFINN
jgi:hypothetical protein